MSTEQVSALGLEATVTLMRAAEARVRAITRAALDELRQTVSCYGPCSWPFVRRQLIEQVPGITSTDDAIGILHEALARDVIRLQERDPDGTAWYNVGEGS